MRQPSATRPWRRAAPRASLLTGRYPERNGIGTVIRASDDVETPLSRDQITIPEPCRDAPRSRWEVAPERLGDIAVQSRLMVDAFVGWFGDDYFSWTENINGVLTAKAGYFAALARYKANGRSTGAPALRYYCPFLAHSPYRTPPCSIRTRRRARRVSTSTGNGRVHRHALGRPRERGPFEHLPVRALRQRLAEPLRPFFPGKVKGSLYEGSVHVPFFAAGPGITPGSECERLVQVTDLMATILELAGAPAPAGFGEDSISFAHLLADPARDHDRTFLYAATFGFPGSNHAVQHRRAIRTERYKLIDFVDDGRQELYDLSVDPFENMDRLAFNSAPAHLQSGIACSR